MIATYTTSDGYTFNVYSSLYLDWGLQILAPPDEGERREIWNSPSQLSNESWGFHWEDEEGNPLDEGIPWTEKEWKDRLEAEADDFIECFDS